MGKKDARIDAYIAKSADFAKPILNHLRKLAHTAGPEVEETVKWSFPHFTYKGILFGMGAFKQHCTLGFWKGSLVAVGKDSEEAMGQFGRITSLKDLPKDKIFVGYVKKAMELNDAGVKAPWRDKPKKKKQPLATPDYFLKAVKKNKKAWAAFEAFSPSKKREYVEWITEAKTDETRDSRLKTAVEWMARGKSRNWKYEK